MEILLQEGFIIASAILTKFIVKFILFKHKGIVIMIFTRLVSKWNWELKLLDVLAISLPVDKLANLKINLYSVKVKYLFN